MITLSARHDDHEIVGVLDPGSLSHPRTVCHYTYRLDVSTGRVAVERTPRRVEFILDP